MGNKYKNQFKSIYISFDSPTGTNYWYCDTNKRWAKLSTICDNCSVRHDRCTFSTNEYCKSYKSAIRRIKNHSKYLPSGIIFIVQSKYCAIDKKMNKYDLYDREIKVRKEVK